MRRKKQTIFNSVKEVYVQEKKISLFDLLLNYNNATRKSFGISLGGTFLLIEEKPER